MNKTFLLLSAPAAFAAVASGAETPAPEPVRAFSEDVAEHLEELRTLIAAKRYDEADRLVSGLIAGAAEAGYDRVALSQVRAQILLANNRYADAVAPLEYAARAGEKGRFIDARNTRELLALLSRVRYRLAQDAKETADKAGYLSLALTGYRNALTKGGTITAQDRLYIATVLFESGTLDTDKPDVAKLEGALAEARESLLLAVAPNDDARVIELSALVRLGRIAETVPVLESLLRKHPENESYRRRLIAAHLGETGDKLPPATVRKNHLRALLAYEDAQQAGQLVTPRDNRTVVGLLLALERNDAAIGKLRDGLKTGAIEDTPANRELLASTLGLADRDAEAEAAYAEAIRKFPRNAALELALGQRLYAREDLAGAYAHIASAVAKDDAPNPGRTRFFLAYLAYELRRYDDATRWGEAAKAFPDADTEAVARLTTAAKTALKEAANG